MHKLKLDSEELVSPTYAGRSFSHQIPKYMLPAGGMSADAAYQLVHDELNLDGNPALNLASFVTSWMEPQADRLAVETLTKNLIDQDEYPQTEAVHQRVVSMIGRLFHAPAGSHSTGTATIGSSEAIMLAMLAHKRSWQLRREAAGEPTDRPNMVMGADVHTCWEKFTRYFEVEARVVPMEKDRYTIGAEEVEPLLDERTIGVAGLLGSTFTGQMDDLRLDRAAAHPGRVRAGLGDSAAHRRRIGGLCDPLLPTRARVGLPPSPRAIDQRVKPQVRPRLPGHGNGRLPRRLRSPEELVFHINYLGGDMPNYSLNFSRPSNSVVLQYFNFLRLGHGRAMRKSSRACSRMPRRWPASLARSMASSCSTTAPNSR